ncbi:prolyl oligopeptidase family serine peptidase [Microbispora sp. H10949]|uniref:prolyl oligopeptidase family serine peptidase n=1 Tax=Microbispora sp. H10949 TaxID=2729111 RepID=UPI0015FF33D1|nr:prolyl oligopeptidase family serine peptidase [Microbispora sp. H10949]
MPSSRRYPDAPRDDVVQELHGRRVPDPYRWLEDSEDPRTLRWTAEQEVLYQAERATWPDADRWRAELAALNATDLVITPKARGSRIFVERRDAGQDHPVLYVREGEAERPLLDVRGLDPAGRTVLESWEPSVEGDRLACLISRDGTEDATLWVLDVATGAVADGPIDRVRRTSIGWLPGGEAFYYVGRLASEALYQRRIYLHKVGSEPDTDVLVFGEGRERTQFYTVAVTPDGRWLTVTAATGTDRGAAVYLADLSTSPPGCPDLRPVQEAGQGRTRVRIAPGTGPHDPMWLRTDRDAARGRVVVCTPADPAPGAWRELIAERPDAVLDDLTVLSGPELARPIGLVSWIRHAAAEITVHDLTDGRELGTVPLPGVGSIGRISVRPEAGHEAWFPYTDYATPPLVLHYDARTGQVGPWSPVPGIGAPRVKAGLETCRSADGTTVRMFVASPSGAPDRPRPAILMGYGGFGVSMSPRYSPLIVAWVEAGGIFATACLRGGGEEGEEWHRAGRGPRKQNTFDDFDAAADHLVEAGWTRPGQLAIIGGSNGGLLVGVALTQHPEKYSAAVCMSPLLDMARYELHGLGPSWVPEYGSAADPGQSRTLLSYSPYHHVVPDVAYPPVLFTASDGDTRVDPLHARKMCAALQHATSGKGPALFRFERGVGHGVRAASSGVALFADCLAFLAAHLGVSPA